MTLAEIVVAEILSRNDIQFCHFNRDAGTSIFEHEPIPARPGKEHGPRRLIVEEGKDHDNVTITHMPFTGLATIIIVSGRILSDSTENWEVAAELDPACGEKTQVIGKWVRHGLAFACLSKAESQKQKFFRAATLEEWNLLSERRDETLTHEAAFALINQLFDLIRDPDLRRRATRPIPSFF
jgi:hypothetical protein